VALRLRVVEISGPTRWRWLLSDDRGRLLADHQVAVDADTAEYEAFCNLYSQIDRRRLPHDPVGSEKEIVDRLGVWIGTEIFGQRLAGKLSGTVRVVVPPEAEFLLARPLELAVVKGVSLARKQVSLVYELPGAAPSESKEDPSECLRVLALFSLPSRSSVLALRRERFELARTVRTIAAKSRKAIELRVLQYGVTRDRLADAVEEYPGWDVLHVSGHGAAGALLLERPNGEPDVVSTGELVELLRPARDRLKFAVLSACNSGAMEAAQTLRSLGLDEAADQVEPDEVDRSTQVGLARGLVEDLGITALAMRYPVADGFAVALAAELYPRLLGAGQPVDRAVALAVPKAAGRQPSAAVPAASIGTPMLIGASAIGLRVAPPPGRAVLDPYAERMAWFPPEPERFVGRTRALVEASTALAPRSGRAGVLFVGMVGAGKSSCAVELAHQHRGRFGALAWWQGPDQPDDFGQALASFAHALEVQLDIPMLEAVTSEDALRRFLPRLAAVLREEAVLLVLDNLDTLLTASAQWRDPMWGLLMRGLTHHGGLSRVVLTSRVTPADLDTARIVTLPTHALSVAESALLARELPNLGRLLHHEPTAHRITGRIEGDRALVRRVLSVAQGLPKLLELADAAAADPDHLAAALSAAEAAGRDTPVTAFFTTGASDLDGGQFLTLLTAWTETTLAALPAAARTLAEILAHLDEDHRTSFVLGLLWPPLWRQLHDDGVGVSLAAALEPLVSSVIVEIERDDPPNADARATYRLHPGVGEAIRARTAPELATRVDTAMITLVTSAFNVGIEKESQGEPASPLVVWAGLAGPGYLLRQGQWRDAVTLLGGAADRDPSPATTNRALGYLRGLREGDADSVPRPEVDNLYAALLARIDPEAATALLQRGLTAAVEDERFSEASSVAADLAELLADTGHLAEALAVADQLAHLSFLADFGPWTRAADECLRLSIVRRMDEHPDGPEVPRQIAALVDLIERLPADAGLPERSTIPSIRDTVLSAAVASAANDGDWNQVLRVGRLIQDVFRQRGASEYEQARLRLNDCLALLSLERLDEAEQLLLSCQHVFEEAEDFELIGEVFALRAHARSQRGRPEEARTLLQASLRYGYQRPQPGALANTHDALATCLPARGRGARDGLAHRLVAIMLRAASEATFSGRTVLDTNDVLQYGADMFPSSLDELAAQVERVPGVAFGGLLAALLPDSEQQQELFHEVVGKLRSAAAVTRESMIAHQGSDWKDALRRAWEDGERGDSLFEGLDDADAELVAAVLADHPDYVPPPPPAGRAPLAFGTQIVPPLVGHESYISSVAYGVLDDTPIAVTGGADDTIRVWDLTTHQPIGSPLTAAHIGSVWSVAYAELHGRPIAISAHGSMRLWDLTAGAPTGPDIIQRKYPSFGNGGICSVATCQLGGRLTAITGAYDTSVRLWDLDTREQIGLPLAGHGSVIRSVACGEIAGRPIALTASEDATGRVWDLEDHTEIGPPLLGHTDQVHAIAYGTLHGQPIAITGSDDATVRIWDLTSHIQIGPALTGHTEPVRAVAYAVHSGRPIAITGSQDLTVRIWDLEDHRQIGTPLIDGRTEGAITSVAHGDHDGRALIVAGSLDHTARVWNLDVHMRLHGKPPARELATLPTTWTDPNTGDVYDLTGTIIDATGKRWDCIDYDGFEPILAEPNSHDIAFNIRQVHAQENLDAIINTQDRRPAT